MIDLLSHNIISHLTSHIPMSDWYKGRTTPPPWDIGRHQPVIDQWLDDGEIEEDIADIGCGTGENVLYIAQQGYNILGLDLSPTAINMAQKKAKQRSLTDKARFEVQNIFDLNDRKEKFQTIIDCGLLHNWDTRNKQQIVNVVRGSLKKGGSYLILGFNEHEPMGIGPSHRISRSEITGLFEDGWKIEYVRPTYFESNHNPGKHNAWAIKAVKI